MKALETVTLKLCVLKVPVDPIMVMVATLISVLTKQFPFFPPAPSNITVWDEAGTEAPPAPPLDTDQFDVLFQLPVPAETQYLVATPVKMTFSLDQALGLRPASMVWTR